ncbi:MAG: hypothetical protein ACK559_33595, partial [bacterium]
AQARPRRARGAPFWKTLPPRRRSASPRHALLSLRPPSPARGRTRMRAAAHPEHRRRRQLGEPASGRVLRALPARSRGARHERAALAGVRPLLRRQRHAQRR